MLGLDTSVVPPGKDSISIFLDAPFWIWDSDIHRVQYEKTNGCCCFNHLLSLPSKDGIQYPLFDFQAIIFDTVERNQYVWIKKARGIGLTTFILRYLAWKILYSSELDYKSIYIVSGSSNKSDEKVDTMLKKLFEKRFPLLRLESKFTDLWLKKTCIKILEPRDIVGSESYDTAYLFIDEADFLEHSEQKELDHAASSFARSNCRTIMASTPNQPGGLFEKIENDDTSRYAKLQLDYIHGIGTIYDSKFIEKKKLDPEFDREYNIKYI
ncbi:MAG TPA: hypothetical protein VF419_03355 [Nitrososphaeraceae archaeon]